MSTEKKPALLSWDSQEGVGYLTLPDHPGRQGCVKRTVDLQAFMPSIKGIQVLIDLDEDDRVIGIELLQ